MPQMLQGLQKVKIAANIKVSTFMLNKELRI